MTRVLHAEWTKLRTTAGPAWLLAGLVVLTAVIGAIAVATSRCPAGLACSVDTAKLSLTGVLAGQALVAILAVLAVSTEYSTGMIRTTLAAMPRREFVFAAKAGLTGVLTLAAGAIAVGISVLNGRLILPGNGFTAARGFADLSLASGPVLRAAAGPLFSTSLSWRC